MTDKTIVRADFRAYKDTEFYAGMPLEALQHCLAWADTNWWMEVRQDDDGRIIAEMDCGNCVWRTEIDPGEFVEIVNMALADASNLGRAANHSPDPER